MDLIKQRYNEAKELAGHEQDEGQTDECCAHYTALEIANRDCNLRG